MMYLNNISFYINPKLCIVVYYIVSHHSKSTIIIIKLAFFGLIKKIHNKKSFSILKLTK